MANLLSKDKNCNWNEIRIKKEIKMCPLRVSNSGPSAHLADPIPQSYEGSDTVSGLKLIFKLHTKQVDSINTSRLVKVTFHKRM